MSFTRRQDGYGSSHQATNEIVPVEPNAGERAQSVPVGAHRPGQRVADISAALQAYSRGEVGRGGTLSRLVAILEFGDRADEAKERALESCIHQMEQIDKSQLRRGEGSGSSHTRSSPENDTERSRSYEPSLTKSKAAKEKRARSYSSGDSEEDRWSKEDGGESSGSGDEKRPRKRLRESDMPWYKDEEEGRRNVNRSCIESSRLLREYGRDLSIVKRWITSSTTAPTGFPSSEWDNLLRGKAVNLDVVFSSVYHIGAVRENRGRIGEHEINFGHSEPSRKVLTNGDWTIAWNLTVKATSFLFPIDDRNSWTMASSFKGSSPPAKRRRTGESSALTSPLGTKLEEAPESCSPMLTSSSATVQPSSTTTGYMPASTRNSLHIVQNLTTSASDLTRTAGVPTPREGASTAILAGPAEREAMEQRLARGRSEVIRGMVPKYRRFNVWDPNQQSLPNTAVWTITAQPLPRPPPEELSNSINCNTISRNPNLFEVSTPINIDLFEELLRNHPNPPFVHSVVTGLREGFWPCADTNLPGYPITLDAHIGTTQNHDEAVFLEAQVKLEEEKGRFSQPFGPDLLPGMYSMPIYAVPKVNGSTFRMVTDHSAGSFSLNSMIDKDHVSPSPLDNMRHVGDRLLHFKKEDTDTRLVMWKADVSEAYRLLPVHPHWQLKQIVTFRDTRYVDRRNTFGGRASGALWIAFMALVTWIALYELHITNLIGAYVDDSFGFDEDFDETFYCPYSKFMPRSQVRLLELWDDLGIPHKEKKQISGSPLTIIGFDVDPNAMSITLPSSAKAEFLKEIEVWMKRPKRGSCEGKLKLKRWQSFTGWFNWALNVYPWLRPALNRIYPKMSGKIGKYSKIYINNAIRFDLTWARDHLDSLPGTRIMSCTTWDPEDADITIFVDACLEGMGIWYKDSTEGFYSPIPTLTPLHHIFYYEALCAVSAIRDAVSRHPTASRIIIYSDSTNTVDIFSSLRATPPFNHILLFAADIVLKKNIDLRVSHVPGAKNVIADAISRLNISLILDIIPDFHLSYFQPPHFPLGALEK